MSRCLTHSLAPGRTGSRFCRPCMCTRRADQAPHARREERVYEREAIFGRDASSVFPTETAKARAQQMEELKKAVGLDSSKFITESQVCSSATAAVRLLWPGRR